MMHWIKEGGVSPTTTYNELILADIQTVLIRSYALCMRHRQTLFCYSRFSHKHHTHGFEVGAIYRHRHSLIQAQPQEAQKLVFIGRFRRHTESLSLSPCVCVCACFTWKIMACSLIYVTSTQSNPASTT